MGRSSTPSIGSRLRVVELTLDPTYSPPQIHRKISECYVQKEPRLKGWGVPKSAHPWLMFSARPARHPVGRSQQSGLPRCDPPSSTLSIRGSIHCFMPEYHLATEESHRCYA